MLNECEFSMDVLCELWESRDSDGVQYYPKLDADAVPCELMQTK